MGRWVSLQASGLHSLQQTDMSLGHLCPQGGQLQHSEKATGKQEITARTHEGPRDHCPPPLALGTALFWWHDRAEENFKEAQIGVGKESGSQSTQGNSRAPGVDPGPGDSEAVPTSHLPAVRCPGPVPLVGAAGDARSEASCLGLPGRCQLSLHRWWRLVPRVPRPHCAWSALLLQQCSPLPCRHSSCCATVRASF